MPPKAKYTREEIVNIALDLVAARGIDALNARNLAAALGTSTRPVFTAFRNMGELTGEVYAAAMARFDEYAGRTDRSAPAFKSVGMQMILFASEQPRLFQLLFMSDRFLPQDGSQLQPNDWSRPSASSFEDLFERLGNTRRLCLEYIKRDYGLDEKEAGLLFRFTWLFTYGICALIAKGVCSYNEKEVSEMLSVEFRSVMSLILSGKAFDSPKYEKGLTPQQFRDRFTGSN